MTNSILDHQHGWYILLVESGFIAVNQADEDAAKKLFTAAQLLDPANPLSKIGFGYMHLHKLELTQACKAFQDVLDKDPENDMCKAFLGICTAMQPNLVDKGEKILEATLTTKDPLIKQLTYTAIDFVERFIKKPAGPATVQKKK